MLLPLIKLSACNPKWRLSWNFHGICGLFYAMNELVILTRAWKMWKSVNIDFNKSRCLLESDI